MRVPRISQSLLLCILSGVFVVPLGVAQAAPPTRTQIKMLTPWTPAGLSVGMAVTQKLSGNCFTHSLASPSRPDAWRCMAGNGLMDPCYQRILGDEKQLACPVGGPWPANVTLLTLTQPLPQEDRKEPARETVLPWALELANAHQLWMSGRLYRGGGH